MIQRTRRQGTQHSTMKPATSAATRPSPKLLVINGSKSTIEIRNFGSFSEELSAGDVLVVNDAATVPGLLAGRTESGLEIEIRLARRISGSRWAALALGRGSWRQPTEERGDPPHLKVGEVISFGRDFEAVVVHETFSVRWLELEFKVLPVTFWKSVYQHGKPIQYSYLSSEENLWSFQTSYASRPWAMEMPSAGKPLSWDILARLLRKGVEIHTLTHATGISSTGEKALDQRLPLRERFDIPDTTVRAIQKAKQEGRRVIAVGTSVVRALEGSMVENGELTPGPGETSLLISGSYRLKIVDGILSGVHEVGQSHFSLLEAFADPALLDQANALAERQGFLTHEFGDSCLVWAGQLGLIRAS